ncbi:hypothetical protein ABI_32350 [Asticcacaulis biprosthecium C19]|uniref:Uncharacterized protein n=1 Tax=Asticcacaulis biprosthecium C19 TaxID=715226 RepID=F4QPT2_9CAUL|nr:hypothetical protein [Asticcacaulis biprosthecium]EGF90219.1 hypothetical protein ABI_32350 [Asticcacaulis biprosthecium C19]
MDHVARTLLYFLFAGIALTLIASGLMWWFEATRRLQRALTTSLGKPADAIVYDLSSTKAAGLDFTAGDLAILWNSGTAGLVYAFDEIEGAELIVDERVVARAQRGEPRRVLNETHANASRVTLRLMFDDVETPEFELNLFGDVSHNPVHAKTAAEAVRLGRKWLSHIDAVIKRMPAAPSPYPTEDTEPAAVAQRPKAAKTSAKPVINDRPPWDDDVENDTDDDEKH